MQRIRTGITWFEAKLSSTRNAVNQFLKKPNSFLYKNCKNPTVDCKADNRVSLKIKRKLSE